MKLAVTTIKPATPWNLTLTKLVNLEKTITTTDRPGMEARWQFGRELMKRRVDRKGKPGVPDDLMKLTMAQCELSKREINYRVQFAERYSTKELMCTAVHTYKSWTQMKQKGLIEKPRAKAKKRAPVMRSGSWVLQQLMEELDKAFAHHINLTRDQVKDLESVISKAQAILEQIDRNDAARAS